MTTKQSSLFIFIMVLSIIGIFALSKPPEWRVLDHATIPKEMNHQQVVEVLDNERIAYQVGEDGIIKVPQAELSQTELLLTGLNAIHELNEEHSSNDVIGELVIQQYLKGKIDELMNSLVGEGVYISEIYVSPTHSSLPINKRIKPHDLVTYFLNSPGVKRIYFRLVVDSDALTKKDIDPDIIESRVKRHLRVLLYELKGVRLTEEFSFVPFHGTGLSSIARKEEVVTEQRLWVNQLFFPLLVGAALIISFLLFLVFKKQKRQIVEQEKDHLIAFNQDFESINFDEMTDHKEDYIQIDSLPPGIIESLTDSNDIGNVLLLLQPKEAATWLQMLPFEQRVKSIGECIGFHHLDMVERQRVLEKISRQLDIELPQDTSFNRSSIKHAANILNELPPANSKRVLQELHQIDATSLIRLKNEFFVLKTLIPLGGEGIKYILKKGGAIDLLLAVNDSDSPIKEKVIDLVPEQVRRKLEHDLSKVDPLKVQAAQLRLTKLVVKFERKKARIKKNYQQV